MSKNKNNRPKEIRSLKGPSRKLELIVEDGKRYIKKHDLQHYFFDQKWKIKDFQYHFGLGHRIVRGSLYKWFSNKKYYREEDYNLPTNIVEYRFYKELIKMRYKVIPQFFFKDLNIHVDFLLDDSIILELDGKMHVRELDLERDKVLNSLGYQVIRIDLEKENLSRFMKNSDIRKCLKKYLLNQ